MKIFLVSHPLSGETTLPRHKMAAHKNVSWGGMSSRLRAELCLTTGSLSFQVIAGSREKDLSGERVVGGVSQRFSCLLVSADSKGKDENLIREQWPSHCASMDMLTVSFMVLDFCWELCITLYTQSSRKSKNDHQWPCTTCGVESPAKTGGKKVSKRKETLSHWSLWGFVSHSWWTASFTEILGVLSVPGYPGCFHLTSEGCSQF